MESEREIFAELHEQYMNKYPNADDEYTTCLVAEYEKFLNLKWKYDDFFGEKFCPSHAIDRIWQLSVLNTKAYRHLCHTKMHYDPSWTFDKKKYQRLYDLLGEKSKALTNIWPRPPFHDEFVVKGHEASTTVSVKVVSFNDEKLSQELVGKLRISVKEAVEEMDKKRSREERDGHKYVVNIWPGKGSITSHAFTCTDPSSTTILDVKKFIQPKFRELLKRIIISYAEVDQADTNTLDTYGFHRFDARLK